MPNDARTWFDNLQPTQPKPGELIRLSAAWTRLQRTIAITAPASLDRCRVWRNRFADAVRFNG